MQKKFKEYKNEYLGVYFGNVLNGFFYFRKGQHDMIVKVSTDRNVDIATTSLTGVT